MGYSSRRLCLSLHVLGAPTWALPLTCDHLTDVSTTALWRFSFPPATMSLSRTTHPLTKLDHLAFHILKHLPHAASCCLFHSASLSGTWCPGTYGADSTNQHPAPRWVMGNMLMADHSTTTVAQFQQRKPTPSSRIGLAPVEASTLRIATSHRGVGYHKLYIQAWPGPGPQGIFRSTAAGLWFSGTRMLHQALP